MSRKSVILVILFGAVAMGVKPVAAQTTVIRRMTEMTVNLRTGEVVTRVTQAVAAGSAPRAAAAAVLPSVPVAQALRRLSARRLESPEPEELPARPAGRPSAATVADPLDRDEPEEPPAKDRPAPAPTPPSNGKMRWMTVTAYCPCEECCGRWASLPMSKRNVASGANLRQLLESRKSFVAGPPEMPFGTTIAIPGYAGGQPVPVLDRGGQIVGNRLDVFFPTHSQAKAWGSRRLKVTTYPPTK